MKNTVFLTILLVTFFAIQSTSSAQIKIGVVNMELVGKQMPEAAEADKKITELRNKYTDTLKMMEKRFTEKLESYQKGKTMMTQDAQRKEEEELGGLRQQALMFQEEKFGAQGTLAQTREQMLRPILETVQSVINEISKTEKLSLVMDRNAAGLLFTQDNLDITFKVLDRLKRGK